MEAYEIIARQMLDLCVDEDIPFSLLARLETVNRYCQSAGGRLMSRQTIAMIIEGWERE